MGKDKINLGVFLSRGLIYFCLFFFLSGCASQSVEFVSIDDYAVLGKRSVNSNDDVRGFIRPEETKELIDRLQIKDKGIDEKVQTIFKYVCEMKNVEEKSDFWQYPRETLQKGGGDCEDRVFLLLSALLEAGVTNAYVIKGRYLGGGHFWVEYGSKILDPSGKAGKIILKDKAMGYVSFFKFDNKDIFINKNI
jgi:hypothetical protein